MLTILEQMTAMTAATVTKGPVILQNAQILEKWNGH